jgi:hypothetical protein
MNLILKTNVAADSLLVGFLEISHRPSNMNMGRSK